MAEPPITFNELGIQRWNQGYEREDGPSIVCAARPGSVEPGMRMGWYRVTSRHMGHRLYECVWSTPTSPLGARLRAR